MSHLTIEVLDPQITLLEVSTSHIHNINNIEIERSDSFNIQLINTEKVLASDLPDDIPISKIVGDLHVSRILGLSDYLDTYEFDCGTP
jgi:hypothetical protein